MKEHFSVGGTTCWFCGWPAGFGNKARKVIDDVLYLACRNCHHAPAGEEAARRKADLLGVQLLLLGEEYQAQYWTQGGLAALVKEWAGQDAAWLSKLEAKPYDDPFAADTHARQAAERKEYAKSYNKQRSQRLKEQYAHGGGKERAAELYQARKAERKRVYEEEGGRERAAAAYAAKQALRPPKPKVERPVKPLAPYDPVKARAYAKEYYQKRKIAAIEARLLEQLKESK